jgi:hypothetical protein
MQEHDQRAAGPDALQGQDQLRDGQAGGLALLAVLGPRVRPEDLAVAEDKVERAGMFQVRTRVEEAAVLRVGLGRLLHAELVREHRYVEKLDDAARGVQQQFVPALGWWKRYPEGGRGGVVL